MVPKRHPRAQSRLTGDPNEAQKVVPTDIQEPKVDPKVIPRGSERFLCFDFAKTCANEVKMKSRVGSKTSLSRPRT